MSIGRVGQRLTKGLSNIGQNLANGKYLKTSKFVESDGKNIGPVAFNTLITSTVIIPRLIQARDADERREILTRDSITILTLLFALKGAKAGLSKLASKSNGLVLTSKDVESGNIFKRIFDFIKPSGITSLGSRQVDSKYGQTANKDDLIKLVNYLKNNGGNPAKVFNTKELADAAQDALGDIKNQNAEEIIDAINQADGAKLKALADKLSDVDNSLTKTGKYVNAWLEAGSFATIIGFLGFGIPALNKAITSRVHAKNKALNRQPLPPPLFVRFNKKQKETFKQFIG